MLKSGQVKIAISRLISIVVNAVIKDATQVFRSELFKDDFVCLVSKRPAKKLG